jgi:hypothetical protein
LNIYEIDDLEYKSFYEYQLTEYLKSNRDEEEGFFNYFSADVAEITTLLMPLHVQIYYPKTDGIVQ